MNAQRFDSLAHKLGHTSERRRLLAGLALSPFAGLVAARPGDDAGAKRKRKRKEKKAKLKRNAFGCVDAGGACQGNSVNCCSGICEGKKAKKGKKDTSVCVAHDDGVCFADADSCTVGGSIPCNDDNEGCFCTRTTGNAAFCGDFAGGANTLCRDCTKDTDCQEEFGSGAACVVLDGICTPQCAVTGRTACAPACAGAAS